MSNSVIHNSNGSSITGSINSLSIALICLDGINSSTRLISKLVFSFASHPLSAISPLQNNPPPPPAVKMPPKGSTIHPPKPPADAPPTAASIQMKANSVGMGEYELPKTTLTKLAKGSVSFVFLVGLGW